MGRPEQTVSISSPAKVANEKQNWRICIPSFISRVWLQRKPEGQMQRDRRLERLPAHWEGAAWLQMLMVCVKVQPGGSLGLRICLFGSHTVPQKAENASGLGQQWGSPPKLPRLPLATFLPLQNRWKFNFSKDSPSLEVDVRQMHTCPFLHICYLRPFLIPLPHCQPSSSPRSSPPASAFLLDGGPSGELGGGESQPNQDPKPNFSALGKETSKKNSFGSPLM